MSLNSDVLKHSFRKERNKREVQIKTGFNGLQDENIPITSATETINKMQNYELSSIRTFPKLKMLIFTLFKENRCV